MSVLLLSLTGRTGLAAPARTGLAPLDVTVRISDRILNAAGFQRPVDLKEIPFRAFVQLSRVSSAGVSNTTHTAHPSSPGL